MLYCGRCADDSAGADFAARLGLFFSCDQVSILA